MRGDEQVNVYGLRADSVDARPDVATASGRFGTPAQRVSTGQETSSEGSDGLREYLAVIARHKLAVLLSVLVMTTAGFVYSMSQTPLYEASASVLVSSGGGGSVLTDVPGVSPTTDPARFAATQVALARLPVVARRTVEAAGLDETPGAFLGRSSVALQTEADILVFTVQDTLDEQVAAQLATTYARQFTLYRNELDLQAIRDARVSVVKALAQLSRQGQQGSALFQQLNEDLRRLNAAEAVQGSAAVLVQPALDGAQVKPQTKRNVALGFVLGLIYGLALAFLIERLDTRVRTAEEVESALGLLALGELPQPPHAKDGRSSMLSFPHGPYAEGVRKLRANFEFVSGDSPPRTVMVTSAVQGEGKTTVAADLAVALARSGRRIALVDLDARAPRLSAAVGIDHRLRRGLADVVANGDDLESVLVDVPLASTVGSDVSDVPVEAMAGQRWNPGGSRTRWRAAAAAAANFGTDQGGRLNVLTFGSRRPSDPGDFVASAAVRGVIEQLAAGHEIVVIDTPPLLPVSDARAISEYVDAAVIVCGLRTSRRRNIRTLRKLLTVFPTAVLGVVVTGTPPTPGYGYGEDSAAYAPGRRDAGRVERAPS